MNAAPTELISVMEALLTSLREAGRHALCDADAVDEDIAVQAQMIRQCEGLFRETSPNMPFEYRARIRALVAELTHSLNVYRLVLRAGFRSITAVAEATQFGSEEDRRELGA